MRLYAPEECGADGYPLAWHQVVKHTVREAAGHRCVRCGHPYRCGEHGNGEWSPCDAGCLHEGPRRWLCLVDHAGEHMASCVQEAKWRILTVHHLDGNKANCRWWNLVSLCQRCHLRIQRKVVMPRIWPWPHSDWFKPYVAGYYALVYEGLEITREQAEARQDELLAYELQVPA